MRLRQVAVLVGLALSLMSGAAHASYLMTVEQVGNDVVASGSGSLDLTGLTFFAQSTIGLGILPGFAVNTVGSQGMSLNFSQPVDVYSGVTGPESFGFLYGTIPNSSAGEDVGILQFGTRMFVPQGYKSGDPLGESNSIYRSTTLADLGVDLGTYKYTWKSDSITLQIGQVSTVPLPSSAPLFGAALLTLAGFGYGMDRWVAPKSKKAAAAA